MNLPELLNKYDIVRIPRLQRDYAHGRNDALSSEIRTELLKDIFTKPELSLNVVFGECVAGGDKKIFMPIDGQQRITTLFLCYLYGWKMLGTENPKLERFSYETRHSTVDFLKELTGREWPYELINSKGGISSAIMDQNWFAWPLQYDPTAVGMLTMLDAIHQMCKSYPFPELDAIEFDFAQKWAESIGQSLYYGLCTGKNSGIVLIMENPQKDIKYLNRLNEVAKKYNIKVWTITPQDMLHPCNYSH